MKPVYEVLSLGAGVGSTTIYMMAYRGDLPPLDAAVFADTGEEPSPVYEHLKYLLALNNPPILQGTIGRLGDHLVAGTNGAGQRRRKKSTHGSTRFASIPAWTAPHHEDRKGPVDPNSVGRTKRQCTKEYKIEIIERVIRRLLLGLKPRQRIPKGVLIRQHFGLTDDEAPRIRAVRARFASRHASEPVFPLAVLGMTRADCVAYLQKHVPHEVPRSACTFCPYRDALGWLWLKENDPAGWQRAVEIDRAVRDPASACTGGMRQSLYLHPSLLPLEMVDIEGDAERLRQKQARSGGQLDLFGLHDSECVAGMCGV